MLILKIIIRQQKASKITQHANCIQAFTSREEETEQVSILAGVFATHIHNVWQQAKKAQTQFEDSNPLNSCVYMFKEGLKHICD